MFCCVMTLRCTITMLEENEIMIDGLTINNPHLEFSWWWFEFKKGKVTYGDIEDNASSFIINCKVTDIISDNTAISITVSESMR